MVGIGSGTTMTYVLSTLTKICEKNGFKIRCIPTSFQAKQLIHDFGLPLTDLDLDPVIDIAIDGADEVDENFVAIKGGGACLAQEKVIANAAKKFVVVADYRKDSKALGDNWKKGIPIEVLPMAYNAVRHQLSRRFNVPLKEFELRLGERKAGPVVTDNGNLIIDWRFNPASKTLFKSSDWTDLSCKIKCVPGVVETGIFADMIAEVYFGHSDGTVVKKVASQ